MDRKQLFAKIMENIGMMHRFGAEHKGFRLDKKNLTRSQICILIALSNEGSKTIKALAKQFSMTSSAVTQIVNGLVGEKLLLRETDMKDRRKINISLTVLGKKKLLMAKKMRLKAMSKYFEPLNENELVSLEKILGKIVEHFNHYGKK